MKNKKKIIIIVISILLIFLSFFIVHKLSFEYDKNTINKGNPPSFALPFVRMKDGGSVVYYGIGYQVIRWHKQLWERKVACEIYEYPLFKNWKDGPESTTQFFEYRP